MAWIRIKQGYIRTHVSLVLIFSYLYNIKFCVMNMLFYFLLPFLWLYLLILRIPNLNAYWDKDLPFNTEAKKNIFKSFLSIIYICQLRGSILQFILEWE